MGHRLIPYHTKIRCTDCGHIFTIRKTELGQCPHCWKRNIVPLSEVNLKELPLPKRIEALKHRIKN